jgi:hypothetical protein
MVSFCVPALSDLVRVRQAALHHVVLFPGSIPFSLEIAFTPRDFMLIAFVSLGLDVYVDGSKHNSLERVTQEKYISTLQHVVTCWSGMRFSSSYEC